MFQFGEANSSTAHSLIFASLCHRLTLCHLQIDDGSHIPEHQIASFVRLFPDVAGGGAYIIEDVEVSYWCRNRSLYGYTTSGLSAIDVLKGLADCVNRGLHRRVGACLVNGVEVADVETVTFADNTVIVTKVRV